MREIIFKMKRKTKVLDEQRKRLDGTFLKSIVSSCLVRAEAVCLPEDVGKC